MSTPMKRAAPEHFVYSYSDLGRLLGRSRSAIYDLMRRDPTFPRPRQLGSRFSVAFVRAEVEAWLAQQPRAELTGINAVDLRDAIKAAKEAAA